MEVLHHVLGDESEAGFGGVQRGRKPGPLDLFGGRVTLCSHGDVDEEIGSEDRKFERLLDQVRLHESSLAGIVDGQSWQSREVMLSYKF